MFRIIFVLPLGACTFVSGAELQRQLDADADGVPVPEDCAPDDPLRSRWVEGFEDADRDGYGGAAVTVCGTLDGVLQVAVDGDCDDADAAVSPVADERCNGIDDDCDGVFDSNDPGLLDGADFFPDADGDGTPPPGAVPLVRCEAPAGHAVAPADGVWDCDDENASIGPGVAEICDGIDNDCENGVDDGLERTPAYVDGDGDGFGSTAEVVVDCLLPPGFVANPDDCDDSTVHVSPAAPEACANGVDEDCDGQVDEEGGEVLRYRDADLDGFSDGESSMLCVLPGPGWLDAFDPQFQDCDDHDSSRFPGAPDVPYDDIDSDCDGADDFDADGDGQRRLPEGTDCNDTDAAVNSEAVEICNAIDDDCDGLVDEPGVSGVHAVHALLDLDLDGSPGVHTQTVCAFGPGFIDPSMGLDDDCDDHDASSYPGAVDVPDDQIDQDCDGPDTVTCFLDLDADGTGGLTSQLAPIGSCVAPGLASANTDCDDADPESHPGAVELCDGVDQDCDGHVETDLISARSRDDGTGEVLWPGLLQGTGVVDLSGYAEITVCGHGPWSLASLVSTEDLSLTGLFQPAPILEFVGPVSGLNVTGDTILENLVVRTHARAVHDPPVVSMSQGRFNVLDVDFDGVRGASALRLTLAEAAEIRGGSFTNGQHTGAPLVLTESLDVFVEDVDFTDNDGDGAGALRAVDSAAVLLRCDLVGNATPLDGGALFLGDGSVADLVETTVTSNTAHRGGAAFVEEGARLGGELSTFESNTAYSGGALHVAGEADLLGGALVGNTGVLGGAIAVVRCLDTEPGCDLETPSAELRDTAMRTNHASRGGGVMVRSGTLILSDVEADGNVAVGPGGHVDAFELSQVFLSGGVFSNGSASAGGTLALDEAVALVDQALIVDNVSTGDGGAISAGLATYMILQATRFEGNQAGGRGGAVYAREALRTTHTDFHDNLSGAEGGGVWAGDFSGDEIFITDNHAGGSGGGLYAVTASCEDCTTTGNISEGSGGGWYGSSLSMAFVNLDSNTAALDGGGAYGRINAYESSITDNIAGRDGGGVYFSPGASTAAEYVTFNRNEAHHRGGGMFIGGIRVDGQEISCADNTAEEGGGFYLENGGMFEGREGGFGSNQAAVGPLAWVGSGSEVDFYDSLGLGTGSTAYVQHLGQLFTLPGGLDTAFCDNGGCVCDGAPCL